jgi:hypothetical protein
MGMGCGPPAPLVFPLGFPANPPFFFLGAASSMTTIMIMMRTIIPMIIFRGSLVNESKKDDFTENEAVFVPRLTT